MLDAIFHLLRRRNQVRANAVALSRILPVNEGWRLARGRGLDDGRSKHERRHWRRVAGLIESRAGSPRDAGGFVPPL